MDIRTLRTWQKGVVQATADAWTGPSADRAVAGLRETGRRIDVGTSSLQQISETLRQGTARLEVYQEQLRQVIDADTQAAYQVSEAVDEILTAATA